MDCKTLYAVHPDDFSGYNTQRIRDNFLVSHIFVENEITYNYSFYDRYMVGGVLPVAKSVKLETIDELKATFFLERRELGIVNVGGTGTVVADGVTYELSYKEALYLGRGVKEVVFKSHDAKCPAKFYYNSAPAHKTYPNKLITKAIAEIAELGSVETCNARTINKLIVGSVVETCQLQMGLTELKTGSVWNTMPSHTHDRRMEAYFYFEVPEGQAVCHFMGQPQETRHIFMQNEEAVISPSWSIHSGAGTSNYSFVWGMAGENLDYSDMDMVQPDGLK